MWDVEYDPLVYCGERNIILKPCECVCLCVYVCGNIRKGTGIENIIHDSSNNRTVI